MSNENKSNKPTTFHPENDDFDDDDDEDSDEDDDDYDDYENDDLGMYLSEKVLLFHLSF